MLNQWQEQLQTLMQCDLKSLFPLARTLQRELVFFVGPTNSGKTYAAFEELTQADCGIYLSPLRLLALEGYETLLQRNLCAGLLTGEEEIINNHTTHICSTIEMLDFTIMSDVVVIDEVQMLQDKDRGWAWINAIIGAPAKKIIMTGSINGLKAIEMIAKYLNEPLRVVKFERKNPLKFLQNPISLHNLKPATALIAFSRSDVLSLQNKLAKKYAVSIIYGNLSPEVRRVEAQKFRDKETQILIATDAIAMGLNLPIKTILFTTDEKFDGVTKRKITAAEITQIAGRAGRYGHNHTGFVGGITHKIHSNIREQMGAAIPSIKPPFIVKANITQIGIIAKYLGTNDLQKTLKFYYNNVKFNGPFIASNIESMIQAARYIDRRNIDIETKFILAQAPLISNSKKIVAQFQHYLQLFELNRKINYRKPYKFKNFTHDEKMLLEAEDEVKLISLYLWLGFKFKDNFVDIDHAKEAKHEINKFISLSLKKGIKLTSQVTRKRFHKTPSNRFVKVI